jgi:hypothetical protein
LRGERVELVVRQEPERGLAIAHWPGNLAKCRARVCRDSPVALLP